MHNHLVVRAPLLAMTVLIMMLLPAAGAGATDYDTSPEFSWIPNGRVYAMISDADRVYIGGSFTRVKDPNTGKSVVRNRLAAFDLETGALDTTWNPNADGQVRALELGADGIVYVGGAFTVAGGRPATRTVALDASGSALPDFTVAPSGEVRDLALVGGSLFVAGDFGTISGAPRVGVAKLDPATGAVAAWNARVGAGRVVALASDSARNRLVIGGNFKTIAGEQVWFLAGVDVATAKRSPWTPARVCDTCNILDLAVDGDSVYAASAGGGGGRAAAWSLTTASRLWIKRGDGDVQAVAVHDGVVYAGGHFSGDFDGLDRHQLAALDAQTGTVLDYAVPFTGSDDPGIWAVTADDRWLRIGGGFLGIVGSSAARYGVLPANTSFRKGADVP